MKFIRLFLFLTILFALSASAVYAQSPVSVSVNVSCSSVTVGVTSRYQRAIKAQVYAGTNGLTEWNLVDDIGDYVRANANGSGSRTYSFSAQPANTQIYFSVRVYDDVTSNLITTSEGNRDCDGAANNAPPTAPTPVPNTGSGGTAPFLAACNSSGGISIQVIGGLGFSVSASQIAQGIANANATRQNYTITTSGSIAVTALTNNSIQITAANGYTLVIAASACGTVTGGSGSGTPPAVTCSNTPAGARTVHVVQAGENLFRIGLRYGVSYTRLASYNGIADPTKIYVGQCIAIPPS
jgi:LysM repeat protein